MKIWFQNRRYKTKKRMIQNYEEKTQTSLQSFEDEDPIGDARDNHEKSNSFPQPPPSDEMLRQYSRYLEAYTMRVARNPMVDSIRSHHRAEQEHSRDPSNDRNFDLSLKL